MHLLVAVTALALALVLVGPTDADAVVCVRPDGCNGFPGYSGGYSDTPTPRRPASVHCRKALVNGVWVRRCLR
jgi:hypothetical protein